MHRYLRQEIRDHELRHVVYGQRDGGASGAARQRADDGDWKLDGGLYNRCGP